MMWFEYKGIRSTDMGLRIEKKNVFSSPKYDVQFKGIPGRNGDLILPNGRYPNGQVTYSVFLPAKTTQELADKITAVKAWLYSEQDQYHTLSDSYDTKYYRKAVFAAKLDIEDELNRIGVFTVSFSCHPFRYNQAGADIIACTASGETLFNPNAFTSKPYIKVYGKGSGSLTVQAANKNATWHFESIKEYTEVDSEQMNCYKGAELKNDTVSGSGFPLLYPGDNTIVFDGGITKVEIIPRWVTL